mgnify:CR=1 FL=1
MTSNTLNAVPATVLETMAERLQGQAEPIKIRSNDDHAALAVRQIGVQSERVISRGRA